MVLHAKTPGERERIVQGWLHTEDNQSKENRKAPKQDQKRKKRKEPQEKRKAQQATKRGSEPAKDTQPGKEGS